MFETNSRYYEIENSSIKKDGREIAYKKRRFLPRPENMIIIQEVTVAAGDRLDQITAHVFGDPEQFWRICDANYEMHPFDLSSEPGKIVRIPMPGR
jgi:hypothetical protein